MTPCPICHHPAVETTEEKHVPLPLNSIAPYSNNIVKKECGKCGWVSRYSQDHNGKWKYSENYGNINRANF